MKRKTFALALILLLITPSIQFAFGGDSTPDDINPDDPTGEGDTTSDDSTVDGNATDTVTPMLFDEDGDNETEIEYFQLGTSLSLTGSSEPNVNVTIEVTNEAGETIIIVVETDENGDYSIDIPLIGDKLGGYTITSSINGTILGTNNITVSNMQTDEVYGQMLQIAEMFQQGLEEILQSLGDDAPIAAQNNYQHALTAISLASRFQENGQTTAAANQIKRALKQMENSMKKVSAVKEITMEPEDARNLTATDELDKANSLMEKLDETIQRMQEEGINTTKIESTYGDTRGLLTQVQQLLASGNETAAEALLEQAEASLEELLEGVSDNTQEVKIKLKEKFQEHLGERILDMENAITGLQDKLSIEESQQALKVLENAQRKLERLQEKMGAGEDVTMDELEDASDDIDEAIDEIDDEDTKYTLKKLNKEKAKIQTGNKSIEKKAKRGLDTSKAENKVKEAQEKLKGFKKDLETGKSSKKPSQNPAKGKGKSDREKGNTKVKPSANKGKKN